MLGLQRPSGPKTVELLPKSYPFQLSEQQLHTPFSSSSSSSSVSHASRVVHAHGIITSCLACFCCGQIDAERPHVFHCFLKHFLTRFPISNHMIRCSVPDHAQSSCMMATCLGLMWCRQMTGGWLSCTTRCASRFNTWISLKTPSSRSRWGTTPWP